MMRFIVVVILFVTTYIAGVAVGWNAARQGAWSAQEDEYGRSVLMPADNQQAPYRLGSPDRPLWLPPFYLHSRFDGDGETRSCRLEYNTGDRIEYRCWRQDDPEPPLTGVRSKVETNVS